MTITSRAVLITAVVSSCLTSMVSAEPFDPGADTYIVERLYGRRVPAALRETRDLRKQLTLQPKNEVLAAQVAANYLALAHAEGDPRYSGYAQMALSPWWADVNPPRPILHLRASIKQYNHDFVGSRADLDRALAQSRSDVQAMLTKAFVLQAQGDYREAERACPTLGMAPSASLVCLSSVRSFSGHAKESDDRLSRALQANIYRTPEERFWVLSILADIAARRGDPALAERRYREAMAVGVRDVLFLANYSDYLLKTGRDKDVVSLLKDEARVDILLLRLSIAEKRLGLSSLKEHVDILRARFIANGLRGDIRQSREEARFALELQSDPAEALTLAKSNWEIQREPEDLTILYEAARAANDPAGIKEVRDWLAATHLEDTFLKKEVSK